MTGRISDKRKNGVMIMLKSIKNGGKAGVPFGGSQMLGDCPL